MKNEITKDEKNKAKHTSKLVVGAKYKKDYGNIYKIVVRCGISNGSTPRK